MVDEYRRVTIDNNTYIEILQKIIMDLKRGKCWCEVGNPMLRGKHSETCQTVQMFLGEDIE